MLNQLLSLLIFVNVVAVVVETLRSLPPTLHALLSLIENISFVLFAIEYVLRIWTSIEIASYNKPILGRVRYAIRVLPLIDLIVLLSFFAPFDLRFLRLVRIVRLLRVLHLQEYEQPLKAISAAILARKHLLVISVVAMLMLMFFAAAGMYYIERDVQPTVFTSIPAAMWWAVMTLTTVGYGDVIPSSPLGKCFAAIIATGGIAVFAMPMAIITAAIIDVDMDSQAGKRASKQKQVSRENRGC